MIAHLKGTVADKAGDHVIVDVGGVGYQVFLTASNISRIPLDSQEISLHIYTHVREDQLVLFGFADKTEKDLFLRLLSVSGVGPKLALTVLSGMRPDDLVQSVIKEDLAALSSIQGIGKKTAERIVVDLKDKFLKDFAMIGASSGMNKPIYNDAMSALINLGYQRNIIEKALCKVNVSENATVQAVVKNALKELLQHKAN